MTRPGMVSLLWLRQVCRRVARPDGSSGNRTADPMVRVDHDQDREAARSGDTEVLGNVEPSLLLAIG